VSDDRQTWTNVASTSSTAGDATLSASGPVYLRNGPVTITFGQHIGANDPLRTGTYSAPVTFTLATTHP
jgi:hypothetical protein